MTPLRQSSTSGELVRAAMPSVTSRAQEICGLGDQAISGPSVGAEDGLAVGVHFRSADLEQAHAAVAGRAERGMVAVVRDEAAALHAGLDELGAFGELAPLAVDLDVDHGGAVAAVCAHGSV